MKKFLFCYITILYATILIAHAEDSNVEEQIKQIPSVTKVYPLENSAGYSAKFDVRFTQPLDHKYPEKGSFNQRVVIMHRDYSRPTVLVTEGYAAKYALNPSYLEELSRLFNTNVIFVEHRFFDVSTPTPCDWKYMTDKNAMGDLHRIVSAFKQLYHSKWISTGISKGGQTCMQFRALYPNDVDVSVPYVGPLCYGVEDGRHEPFLQKCGTPEDRQRIQDFQLEALKRKSKLLPAFQTHCLKNNLRFNIPIRDVYDYCVLEYSFAHWQWGTPTSSIPNNNADDYTILKELLRISGPDYFSLNDTPSFFYQAAYELGYYGYDLKPFKKYTSIKSTRNYLHRVMLPDSLNYVHYHKDLSRYVRKWLKKNDPQMLFIYGEIDPWTAAGVTWLKDEKKKNMHVFIQPNGSHKSRISNMPPNMRKEILDILSQWIGEQPSI